MLQIKFYLYKDASHTTHKTAKKCSYHQYTLQLFLTTAMIFSTDFDMSNDFLTEFLRKTIAVLCVVCEGR